MIGEPLFTYGPDEGLGNPTCAVLIPGEDERYATVVRIDGEFFIERNGIAMGPVARPEVPVLIQWSIFYTAVGKAEQEEAQPETPAPSSHEPCIKCGRPTRIFSPVGPLCRNCL